MKRALICSLLIGIALVSCKKDIHVQTNPNDNKYPVTYSISNFSQQNGSIDQISKSKVNSAVTPDQSNIIKLIYKIYDSNNQLKKTVFIKKGVPGFGVIKDSLASGNYTAVFVGLTDTTHFKDYNLTFGYVTTTPYVNYDPSFKETFYKKTSFTVGNQYLQQDVVLQRITSQLQIVIKDAIPAGVSKFNITVTGWQTQYSYFADTSSTYESNNPANIIGVPCSAIGTTNYAVGPITNLLNTNSPIKVVIIAQNNNDLYLAQKTITNITLQRNTRTILTGNLFSSDNAGGSGFSVTYNPAYNSTGINQGF